MKRLLGLLALLALASTPAYARRDKGPRAPRTPSSEERKNKSITLEGQPLTLFTSPLVGGSTSGASAGVFLGPDTVLRFTARSGKSCLYERCSYVETSASATIQQFVANSLFVEGGIMVQRNIFHYVDFSEYDYGRYDSHFTHRADTAGPTFALGNQWQWHTFTLGVRWFQIYQPTLHANSEIREDDPSRAAGEKERRTQRVLEAEQKLYLPSISLGYAF